MAALAKSLSSPRPGWFGSKPCKWQVVNCDSSGKISSISLPSMSLTGKFEPTFQSQIPSPPKQSPGPLPSLSNLASLQDVNLDGNNFSSIPPDFQSGLTSLQTFSINNNSNLPPWKIPDTLKDSTSLVSFNAGKANLVGQIPDIFGSFPKSMAQQSDMGLSGTIDVIGMMSQLTKVWLHVNEFSGPILDLPACTELYDIQLRDNFLTSVIPYSFTKLLKLKTVMLQNNIFQGPQPGFSNGVQLILGTSNNFCNPSPCPCDPHGSVTVINFAKQNWVGTISPAITNLSKIKTVLLNDNNLTSTIPDSLTSLKLLQLLDVSKNNLSGKIPQFSSSVTLKTTGNKYIGIDLPLIPLLCYAKKRSAKYKWVNGSELGNSEKENETRENVKSTSKTLIRSSCEKSDYHVGGFGVVYRGQLHDGMQIAVKRMESIILSDKGINEFKAEIEVLTKVRHRNLVALHRFYDNGNERLLVYEHMSQGSLGQHLFHWEELGLMPLTWNQRVTISLEVARGVEYIHSLAQQSFIHRDLKPTNILLGDDMRAKVFDFGLVRSVPDGKYLVETRLTGTFGYLAPKYPGIYQFLLLNILYYNLAFIQQYTLHS
ncbi:unnamed protein product [Fraxinus pennsylvanica]|uniref:Protein kinase domain-containing protein n=1 Tax=Fraxinus pennsylvanica TaxID=56036 RepID=A0AAD2A0Y9_9LAMI|nr:unnamed protein product [Fraxinus pennsylvanica]